jgi:hypothetical protein
MKKKSKVLGGKNLPSIWERFNQLQRTTDALLPGVAGPRGVFRFRTFEEFNLWKDSFKSKQYSSTEVSSSTRPK